MLDSRAHFFYLFLHAGSETCFAPNTQSAQSAGIQQQSTPRTPKVPKVLGSNSKARLNTPKAVTYHEQSHCYRFMIGHSLGRMESRCCLRHFGVST